MTPDTHVVILGASYARGWEPAARAPLRFTNRGIDGQQSWELLARFDADVVALRPQAVVIWGYINDVFRSPKTRIEETLARARSSFETMIARARAAGIEPVVATELTVRGKAAWGEQLRAAGVRLLGRRTYQDYVNGHVARLNDWLRTYASREGLLLLDVHAALSDGAGRRRRAFAAPDGSHVSRAGYVALDEYAEPRLEARLCGRV